MLKVLEVEGAVERRRLEVAPHFASLGVPGRTRRAVTGQRRDEQARMRDFLAHRRLPDAVPAAASSTRQDRARRADGARAASARISSPSTSTRRSLDAAVQFLQGQSYAIDPRKRPGGRASRRPSAPNPGSCSRSTTTAAGARLVKADKATGASPTRSSTRWPSSPDRATVRSPRPSGSRACRRGEPRARRSLAERVAAGLGLPFVPVVRTGARDRARRN